MHKSTIPPTEPHAIETWKDIENHCHYQVSNLGRVKRIAHTCVAADGRAYNRSERIKSPYQNKVGYMCITLDKKTYLVHRLVAAAFLPNPEDKPQVNHKNLVKNDNRVVNLEFTTPKENIQHARANGAYPVGVKAPNRILKEEDIPVIRQRLKDGDRNADIARDYNVNRSLITNIKKGRAWKHV